ncbi:MAG: T9SS type A sorting domain-containing protein [Flavobacteriales bacterium]
MRTLLLSLSLPLGGALLAQPALTAANSVGAPGQDFPVSTGVVYNDPGNTGASVTYDFSQLPATGNRVYSYLSTGVTPSSSMVPTATLLFTDGGTDTLFYAFGANGLELRGERNAIVNGVFTYSDPGVELKLPCDYQDTWTDQLAASYSVQGFPVTRTGTITGVADGWGMLELPEATLDEVMRVKVHKVIDDQSALTSVHRSIDIYYFFNAILGHPVLKLTLDSTTVGAGNPVIVKSTEWMFGNGDVGLEEIDFDEVKFVAYPNPADGQVNLSFGAEGREARAVEVFTVAGQRVLQAALRTAGSEVNSAFDVSALVSGVYQVRVTFADGGNATQRLVVR